MMTDLIVQLLRLATAWTGYPEPAVPPEVHLTSAADMPCRCLGVFLYAKPITGYGGATVLAPGRLLLRDDVNLMDPYGRSILLHELVHVLQAHAGAAEFGSRLWYQREREAYRVQSRFLSALGPATQSFLLPGED